MGLRNNSQHVEDLEKAVALLTAVPVIIKLSNAVGSTLEVGMKKLPAKAQAGIAEATRIGLNKSIALAGSTLESKKQKAWTTSHMVAAATSGAVGGFFGLSGLLIEIPVTTTLMMRSILDIARSEGHDIQDLRIQFECLDVFRIGSRQTTGDDGAETGYYAGRAAVAEVIREAAKQVGAEGAKGAARGISSTLVGDALAKLIEAVAARFGVVITQKAALQAAPFVGALTGATVNSLFMDYYQDTARGHFIVLRLSKEYGADVVQQEFDAIRTVLAAKQGVAA